MFEIYGYKFKVRFVKKVVCCFLIVKRLRIIGNVVDD